MKGPFLLTVILALSIAAVAQVNVDSLEHDIDRTVRSVQLDSIHAGIQPLPDTLREVYSRIDSIRTAFATVADSLQNEYRLATGKVDSAVEQLRSRVDSLATLRLPASRYAKTLDSLNDLRHHIREKFAAGLEALKSRTTDKLDALNLPPEYQEPLQELAGKINSIGLESNVPDIPRLDIPGISVQGLKDIPALSSKVLALETPLSGKEIPGLEVPEGAGRIAGQAGQYQQQIDQIAANATDADKLPEVIEQQASKVEGMSELQKQAGVVGGYRNQVESLNDPDKAKQKAVELGRKAAVDHFAGKQEQLKAAMEKISKYKQKYSSVSSIRDLPRRPPNPMKGKPFLERLVPGLFLQYQRKNFFLADFNPYVGYRISGRLTSGVGWNQRFAFDKDSRSFNSRSRVFGPRAYVDFKLGKGFIAHVEGESMNTFVPSTLLGNPDSGQREWVWSTMTGIKKEYRIYKNLKGTALIQYNLFNRHYKAPYVDRLNSRIGFEYAIKLKKKGPRRKS